MGNNSARYGAPPLPTHTSVYINYITLERMVCFDEGETEKSEESPAGYSYSYCNKDCLFHSVHIIFSLKTRNSAFLLKLFVVIVVIVAK